MNPGEGEFTFVDTHNKPANESFSLVNEWVAQNYNNSKEVIQLNDYESNTIIIKGITKSPVMLSSVNVWYTLTIKTKDEKIQYKFVTGQTTQGFYPSKNGMDELEATYQNIRKNITSYINNQSDF